MPTSKGKRKGKGMGREGKGAGVRGRGDRVGKERKGKKGREGKGRGVPPLLSLHFKHCSYVHSSH